MGAYEASHEFDQVLYAISRNRKYLLENFESAAKKTKVNLHIYLYIIIIKYFFYSLVTK